MPDKPAFAARAPQILIELQSLPGDLLDRKTVGKLLGVQSRRALQVMHVAGAEEVGKNLVMRKTGLVRYLERFAAECGGEERIRRSHLARVLNKLERDRIDHPPLLVPLPTSTVSEICRKSLDALPWEGIYLDPGTLLITYTDGPDLLQKLAKLSAAIATNYQPFLERTAPAKVSKSPRLTRQPE